MTFGADFVADRDAGVTAVDVAALEMENGIPVVASGRNVILAATLDEALYERALNVVRHAGGKV
ncbi:MAG: hypothetical protein C4570_06640 [Ammonifex sp.]|nr:MAG: hypothetical protein C4570_06640 [Ammonifex sp.]